MKDDDRITLDFYLRIKGIFGLGVNPLKIACGAILRLGLGWLRDTHRFFGTNFCFGFFVLRLGSFSLSEDASHTRAIKMLSF